MYQRISQGITSTKTQQVVYWIIFYSFREFIVRFKLGHPPYITHNTNPFTCSYFTRTQLPITPFINILLVFFVPKARMIAMLAMGNNWWLWHEIDECKFAKRARRKRKGKQRKNANCNRLQSVLEALRRRHKGVESVQRMLMHDERWLGERIRNATVNWPLTSRQRA